MGWLSYRVRADLRRRWRALVALAMFVALVGGVVLTAAAGARRTSTAVDRLGREALEPHTFLDTREADPAKTKRIADLPSVEVAAPVAFTWAFPRDEGYYPLLAAMDDQAQRTVAKGLLVAGRRPRPGAADEIVVAEAMAERLKLRAGSSLHLDTFTEEGAARLEESEGNLEPDGPPVTLRVVGIVRATQDVAVRGDDPTISILPRAFYEKYRGQIGMAEGNFLMRFRDGPDASAAFVRELRQLYAGGPSPGIDAGTNTVQLLGQSTDVQATGLAVFAGVFLLFGVGAVAQAMTRSVYAGSPDQVSLASIGATRQGRLLAAALPSALAAAAGCLGAIAVAMAASPILPVGLARQADPDPGVYFDTPVVLGGAGVLLAIVLGLAVWPAWRLSRRPLAADAAQPPLARPSLANRLARTGRPSLAVGVDMATRQGRGATEVAVRTAFAGVLVGVAGLAATVVFAASLQGLLDTPARYGWTWDVAASTADDTSAVEARADVDAVAIGLLDRTAEVGGRAVYVTAIEPKKGTIDPPVADGRAPRSGDEVALGAELRGRLGDPDRVLFRANEREATFRVVGTAVSASVGDPISMDGGALMTPDGLKRLALYEYLQDSSGYNQALIKFRPGVDVRKAAATIKVHDENDRTITYPSPPPEVEKLVQVRGLPRVLGLFLAALAAVALLHALVQTVQRRRTELGVLRAIGFTRGQVAGAIGWQAAALAVVGAAVGLPAGVAVGRWVWTIVADGLGIAPQPEVAVPLLLVVPAAVAVAALLGSALGGLAGRTPPAISLRTE
ncbi:MAG: putative transport system permease protein [Actinomycetota bacterium]|jgi:hypothetical protein